jgi:AcrR family transcriptional regulator
VVPLAKQLGATKGSFYWHFANREALVEAALAEWEQSHTAAVIAEIEASSDEPLQQLSPPLQACHCARRTRPDRARAPRNG